MQSLNRAAELERIDTPAALWIAVLDGFRAMGFDFVIYLTANDAMTNSQVLTNIPEIYAETDPLTDPFLHYCCKSYEVTLTGPEFLSSHVYLPPDALSFINRASQTGFISGVGVPTRIAGAARFGGFNIGTSLSAESFRAERLPLVDDVRLFCLLAHRRLEEVYPPEMRNLAGLSRRERDVIALIARGHSRKDCARMLDLSPNTVADYSKSAYRKLGVNNRVEVARLLQGEPREY